MIPLYYEDGEMSRDLVDERPVLSNEKRLRKLFAMLQVVQGKLYGELFKPGTLIRADILSDIDAVLEKYVEEIA